MSTRTDASSAATKPIQSSAQTPEGSDEHTKSVENDDLERIRTLLFGEHVDGTDRRFARIEEQLAALRTQLDAIEARLAEEARQRTGALEEEQRARARLTTALDEDLKQRAGALSREFKVETSTLRDDVAAALAGIAQQLTTPAEPKKPTSR